MRQQLNTKIKPIAKRSLGQNFIHDQKFLSNLAKLIKTNKNCDIIEIGPGHGALTDHLLKKKFNKIFLIEKDVLLSNILEEKYKDNNCVKIISDDALNVRFENISPSKEIIIVGNLPFNISSQLLFKWISYNDWPPFYKKMYLMFQFELGKRITSNENKKNYGKISVLTQVRCKINQILIAPSRIFYPKPKVNGVVLEFSPIEKYSDINLDKLNTILKLAFEKKRKKLSNSLKSLSKHISNWEMKKDLRPENLKVSDYVDIVRNIN